MPLSDDPWIAQHSIIDPERLHALGMITLWWNHCERNLFHIFRLTFKLRPRVGWIIANDIGDISLCEKIKEMMKIEPPEPDVLEVVTAYLKAYDICRQNRNMLSHFTGNLDKTNLPDLSKVTFVRMKGPSAKANELPSSLEDVRRVAHETHVLCLYSWRLYKVLLARGAGKPAELLPPVAPPELLWKPPPPIAPKPKRPPRPSPASRRKKR